MTNNPGFNENQGYQPGYGPSGGGQPRGQGYSQPVQGYPAQGYQPQGQGYQQGQPPQQPGQGFQQPGQGFTAPAPKKGPSKLVVLVCILAALCLLLSAGLVYMFVNQDKSDITKGIVPVGELLELDIPELDAKAFSPYTLFLPEEDAAVVIMQTANGAKMQKFITATTKKTAEKVGDLIELPACPTNSTRPYVVKGSNVVCSEKPVITKNENKNYEFNETIYTNETIIIGASPSAAAATQIVAYQPGNNQPLWVENLNTPASVSTNGETICTATTNEDGKIDIQGYVGAEKQDKTENAKPSKEALAPDFMKNYDFANTYLPICDELLKPNNNFEINLNETFPFNEVPSGENNCWLKLSDGVSRRPIEHDGIVDVQVVKYDDAPSYNYDVLENYYENTGPSAFIDLNQDGYLDAFSAFGFGVEDLDGVGNGGGSRFFIFIANPENPEQPYVGEVGYMMPEKFVNDGNGTITVHERTTISPKIYDREITVKEVGNKLVGYITVIH